LVLVPVYVAAAVQHGGWRRTRAACAAGVAGTLAPVLAFLLWGGSFAGLLRSLEFHARKPVGLEGIWAGVVMALQWTIGQPIRITAGYGVQGLTSDLPVLTNRVLNDIWLLPYAIVLWLIWRGRHQHLFQTSLVPFTVLLVFVVFAKVLNPQYLWWFVSLAPLIEPQTMGRRRWWLLIVLLGVSAGLSQLVYPLHYTEFVNWFRTSQGSSVWFTVALLRNSLLLIATLIAITVLIAMPRSRSVPHPGHDGPSSASTNDLK
jgi:hypothetical protein